MDNLRIREFRIGDSRQVISIHRENEQYFENFPISEGFIQEINKRPDFKFLVAELDGKVVGFLGMLFQLEVARAEIGPIGLTTSYKNRKIGKKLLEEGLEFLERQHIKRIISRVKSTNEHSIRFFGTFGFCQEGYFRKYTRENEDVIQLVKFL